LRRLLCTPPTFLLVCRQTGDFAFCDVFVDSITLPLLEQPSVMVPMVDTHAFFPFPPMIGAREVG
jgi:hypothetical protein